MRPGSWRVRPSKHTWTGSGSKSWTLIWFSGRRSTRLGDLRSAGRLAVSWASSRAVRPLINYIRRACRNCPAQVEQFLWRVNELRGTARRRGETAFGKRYWPLRLPGRGGWGSKRRETEGRKLPRWCALRATAGREQTAGEMFQAGNLAPQEGRGNETQKERVTRVGTNDPGNVP